MKNNNKQDIILFEEMASNAHVALNIMQYDGWILKFSEGHTNRANSVSMIYPSIISVNEKIQNCEKIYSEQNLPCVFKLTDGDEQMMKLLIERGYMLIQNVVVNPDYRRKGYGKLLCKALMSKGKSDGAKTAWLQVVQSNEGAYKLYDGLGFKKVYTYRYLKKEL